MIKVQSVNFNFGLSCGLHILSPFDCFHCHQEIEVTFFEKLPVKYRIGNLTVTLNENEMLLFWGAIPHQLVETRLNNTTYYMHIPLNIFFQWQLPDEIFERLLNGEVFKAFNPDGMEMDKMNFTSWARYINHQNIYIRKAVLLNMEARILHFIADSTTTFDSIKYCTRRNQDKSTFLKLYKYLLKHYRNNKSIKQVANEFGMNPNYISELFKNNSGMNIVDFVNMLKVAAAQKLLLTTRMQVIDIAFEVGFGSLSNFNLVFKKYCHMSPLKCRSGSYEKQF
jgi:AraC-like DNA-binding protein